MGGDTRKKGQVFSAVAGYSRLPSNIRAGSQSDFNKQYTRSARESMAEIIRKVDDLFLATKASLPDVLLEVLQPTFDKTQVYCPVKTGKLISSGSLSVEERGNKVRAELKYGGSFVHYAAIVHERTDLSHVEPTRSKYVQSALEEDVNEMPERIYAALLSRGLATK